MVDRNCRRPAALLCLLLVLLLSLTAAGCARRESKPASKPVQAAESAKESVVETAEQEVPADADSITAVLSDGGTALLDSLPGLKTADLSGSENVKEIAAWAAKHPEVDVTYTVRLPDGSVLDSHTETVDLSRYTGAQLEAAADALSALPALKKVVLGAERPEMSWESIEAFRAVCPTVPVSYDFDLYGTWCNLEHSDISLYHVPIDYDDGQFLDRVMYLMPQLTYVDLDGCDLPMWRCEAYHTG